MTEGNDRSIEPISRWDGRNKAILETALDCIIMMDASGFVVEFNPAAERTFGYLRENAIGRELAELIVPHSLRERHRKGLAHYVATGEGPVIGKRIELTALHADGSEFPVELAITRVEADGPPLFTAYVRDIRERVRAEELRNARMGATQALTQANDLIQGLTGVLGAVGENLRWEVGLFWMVAETRDALTCVATWSDASQHSQHLVAASLSRTLKVGEGLPGRAWASGDTAWIPDVTQDDNFPRALPAGQDGLSSAFGCPVILGARTLGVMEFLTRETRTPEQAVLETVSTVCAHVGQFLERCQAEATLRRSEERFRSMMDQAPFSVQIFAPDGRTLRVNKAWCELWGVTMDQIADYNILEDRQLEDKGVLPYIRNAFAGNPVNIPPIKYDPTETLPHRSRNATPIRWVSAVAYPLKDDAGRVREIVLVHDDITARRRAESELRESEAKLRLLADTIPQLAWMAHPDGSIFWYNKRWFEYTGTTEDEMKGWGWQSVHDPEVLPEVLSRWEDAIANGERFEMVFPLKGADGTYRAFLTRVNPLPDPGGRVTYWFGTNTDISEIKRMEDALREADRRKDEFLAMLAHELRNPLAPIRNALELLKQPGLDDRLLQRSREIMERQVRQLVRLVDDLLDVSRVTRGKVELHPETIELAVLIARAVEIVKPVIEAQGHSLDVSIEPKTLLVHADPIRFGQVVSNLLANSAKYTNPDGQIALSARQDAESLVLSVRDNGIGIPPELLPHVFDLFVQADHGVARSQGGLGIGLTLVKNIVELHGGTVEAHSQGVARGAEFVIRMPLRPLKGHS